MGFRALKTRELKGLGPLRFEASGDFISENQGNAVRQDSAPIIECKYRVLKTYAQVDLFRKFFL